MFVIFFVYLKKESEFLFLGKKRNLILGNKVTYIIHQLLNNNHKA